VSEAIRQGDIPGVQLRCRRSIDLPVDAAWPFLVEPARLEAWLCRRARAGEGVVEWVGSFDLEGEPTETVRILESQAPRRLLTSLNQADWTAATRLEFELFETEHGCEVSVLQNGFEHLPLSISLTVWEAYRRRWRAALDRLATQVEPPRSEGTP